MHHRLEQGPFYTNETLQQNKKMAQKNQDQDDQWDSTPRSSRPQNKTTPSMTVSSLQSCAVCDAGHTSSKAQKSPSWYTLIMQILGTIGTQGRLGPGWLATCQKGSNTTYYWSTNLALLTVQMHYHDDLTMKGQTQTTKMSWYGQMNISVKTTLPSVSLTSTVFTTT